MVHTATDIYRERILRVLVHLEENLDGDLGIARLASLSYFSPHHFHRIFRALVGEPVAAYVRRLRLERAAGQLVYTRRPVTEIAFACGYEAHESFTRAFSSRFDCSPSEFRRRHGKDPATRDQRVTGQDLAKRISVPAAAGTGGVTLETLTPVRVVFLRQVGPYHRAMEIWGRLLTIAYRRDWIRPGVRCFGVGHDDPSVTPPDRIRYDACLALEETPSPDGEIGIKSLPGGRCAVIEHRGSYARLSETYERLFGVWLPGSGYEPLDEPVFQEYVNRLGRTAPEDLITRIFLRVRPVTSAPWHS